MTFYRFFANKAELAKAVFDKEANDGLTRFRQILTEPCDPAERIRKIIMMKVEGAHEISREFLQDFYGDRELGLKSHIEKRTQEMWVTIVDEFKDAQRKGYFRADFKPEFLLFFSQRMGEWISDERLLGLYPSPQALVMELIKFVSYGITPRAEEGVAAHDNRNLRL